MNQLLQDAIQLSIHQERYITTDDGIDFMVIVFGRPMHLDNFAYFVNEHTTAKTDQKLKSGLPKNKSDQNLNR